MQRALIIFVKNPVLGEVKTRLAATVGEKKALQVYINLLKYTKQVTRQVKATKYVYTNKESADSEFWPDSIYQKELQIPHDLGARMKKAFEEVLASGRQRICLIGSDCPVLTTEHIEAALNQLKTVDVVLGPSRDGGYYLIGLNSVYNELFDDINWSTDEVLSTTLERCAALGLQVSLLPELSDVDVEADLRRYPWLID